MTDLENAKRVFDYAFENEQRKNFTCDFLTCVGMFLITLSIIGRHFHVEENKEVIEKEIEDE